jgi:hypothetical protein
MEGDWLTYAEAAERGVQPPGAGVSAVSGARVQFDRSQGDARAGAGDDAVGSANETWRASEAARFAAPAAS